MSPAVLFPAALVPALYESLVLEDPTLSPANPLTGMNPVGRLSDEFNQDQLDRSKWVDRFVGWDGEGRKDSNGTRLFTFNPENVAVAAGKLQLSAEHGPDPAQRFNTSAVYSKETLLYGYVEIRAKAANSGISSNFWLTNNNQPDYGSEIDVFELAGGVGWNDKFHTTLHAWYTPTQRPKWADRLIVESENYPLQLPNLLTDSPKAPDVTTEYYTYGLHWTAETITIYLDGQMVSQQPNTHWHQPMHLVIDREAYENWFPLPEAEQSLGTFEVDYVRVWQTPEQSKVQEPWGVSGSLVVLPSQPGWQIKDAADFDRDGQPDLLAYSESEQKTQLWILEKQQPEKQQPEKQQPENQPPSNQPPGNQLPDNQRQNYQLREAIAVPSYPGQVPLGAGDFDRDGDADLVMQQFTDIGWIGTDILLMDKTQQDGPLLSYNNNTSWDYAPLAIGDFNQDGASEILAQLDSEPPANQRRNKKLWLNGGFFIDPNNGQQRYVVDIATDLPAWVGWEAVAAGDFNQDGRSELIVKNPAENWNGKTIERHLILFLEDEAGLSGDYETRIQGTAPLVIPDGWKILGVTNFNPEQDSFADLLVHNAATGENGVIFLAQNISPYDPLNLPAF